MQTTTTYPLERRTAGKTGLNLSILGFGCAPIGSRAGPAESERALLLAWENGIRYFDTADMYGLGGSEKTLGSVLGGRDGLVVSTKAGFEFSAKLKAMSFVKPLLRPLVRRFKSIKTGAGALMTSQKRQNFEPAYLEQCINGSLSRLGVERLDLFYLHEPPESAATRHDVYVKLAQMKKAGKLREYGISAEPHVVAAALDVPDNGITAAQVNVNLLEPEAFRSLLPKCRERGIGFIARQPFAHGLIVNDERLKVLLAQHGLPTDSVASSSLALRYVRAFDGVATILPSMMKPEHLRANVAAASGPALSDAELAVISALGAPLPSGGGV